MWIRKDAVRHPTRHQLQRRRCPQERHNIWTSLPLPDNRISIKRISQSQRQRMRTIKCTPPGSASGMMAAKSWSSPLALGAFQVVDALCRDQPHSFQEVLKEYQVHIPILTYQDIPVHEIVGGFSRTSLVRQNPGQHEGRTFINVVSNLARPHATHSQPSS